MFGSIKKLVLTSLCISVPGVGLAEEKTAERWHLPSYATHYTHPAYDSFCSNRLASIDKRALRVTAAAGVASVGLGLGVWFLLKSTTITSDINQMDQLDKTGISQIPLEQSPIHSENESERQQAIRLLLAHIRPNLSQGERAALAVYLMKTYPELPAWKEYWRRLDALQHYLKKETRPSSPTGRTLANGSANPNFQAEQDFLKLLNTHDTRFDWRTTKNAVVISLSDLDKFLSTDNGILLIPDQHNSAAIAQAVGELLRSTDVPWCALELTSFLDGFSKAYTSSAVELPHFWEGLEKSFNYKRVDRNNQPVTPDPMKEFFAIARRSKKRLIFSDVSENQELTNKYSVSWYASVRNAYAVNTLPAQGRGIIFWGRTHFVSSRAPNMQDFIRSRFPDRPIFLLDFSFDINRLLESNQKH